MFGKILRAGKGGHGCKYKIDVQITQLENLPTSIKKCRVVWARSAKLQITDIKDVRGSVASFKQTLTQVTTIYRDKAGKYEPKEYEFKVQVPGKSSSDSPVTIGKANLDMAKYCKEETTTQPAMLPIPFKVGGSTTGYLRMNITTIFLGDSNEDGLTEVSGLTGLTSDHGSVREQDLEGFADEEQRFGKKSAKSSRREDPASSAAGTSGRSSKSDAPRRHKPLPPTAEEDASDLEDEPAAAPVSKAIRKKASVRQPEIEEPEEEANPFTKKVSKPPSRRIPPKVWEDDEDVSPLNSDISDSETPKPAPKGKSSKAAAQEPDESLDDMKASLFATKKAAAAPGRGTAGQSASTSSAAASSSKFASTKSGKPSAPPPPPMEDDEDGDNLRNDLFTVKSKASATVASSRPKAATASAGAAAFTAGAIAAAEFSGASGRHHKSKAVQRPPAQDDEDDEDDDYGPSTSAAPVAALKSRSKADSRATDAGAEAPVLKGSSSLTRAGSSKPDAGKGVSTAEMEAMRQRISQLEQQLADERAVKDELNKKVQKYTDKISDLEEQLAEGDVTELYAQMREMEAKHQAEIKEMETKYQAEIKELMERHLTEISELEERHEAEVSELQEAASVGGRGGVSSDELKRLQAELAEQEGLLKSRTAKLEAEQAAANAARQAAEAKLAEANKAIDDTLLVATKHQQENKVLQEEIAKLKRQLEDASMWETSAAVAAVTAASNNGRRSSEDEAELDELRERLEELQEENARLQKLVNARGRGSRGASDSEDKKRFEELQAANRKLEAVCDDLEEKAQIAQEKADKLQAELEATKEKIRVLEAAAAVATTQRLEDELGGGGGGGRQSKEKVADLEARVTRLARENAALEEQLEDERATRVKLEDTLKDKLDRAGDDEAAETVAAFEVKYNRLKERYKMLEESSQEELDELQDQLTEALSQITDLQRQVKQLQSQVAQGGSSRSAAAANSANMEELRNLRSENERLVQQLVAKKLELAELSESEITMKRELARLHEVNMKLAQKATTLEAQAAMAQAGKAGRGKK